MLPKSTNNARRRSPAGVVREEKKSSGRTRGTRQGRSGRCGSFPGQEVADIGTPSRQNIIVECLLLIHVVHRSLELGNLLQQHLTLLRQNDLALGNGVFALKAQLYITWAVRRGII